VSRVNRRSHILSFLVGLLFCSAATADIVIDSFRFEGDRAAAQAWAAKDKSPKPRAHATGVLFELPFAKPGVERAYWDRAVSLDLSSITTLEFELTCDQPAAVRKLTLYLKSGEGWYACSKSFSKTGRQRVVFPKAEFSTEGKPAGWNRIQAVRLSPWKGADQNVALIAHSLTARKDGILVVRATSSAPSDGERAFAKRVADRVTRWLAAFEVPHSVTTDDELDSRALAQARVVILPYNPQPQAAQMSALRGFVQGGGKLMVFYSSSAEMAELMGLKLGEYKRTDQPGAWSVMAFDHPERYAVPASVRQQSMNIFSAFPKAEGSRIIAHWRDGSGAKTGPAWLESPRGFWMTHVLLEDDPSGKQQMLLALLAQLDPPLWPSLSRQAVEQAGRLNSYSSYSACAADLRKRAADGSSAAELLDRADSLRTSLLEALQNGQPAQAFAGSFELRRLLQKAYGAVQSPVTGEFRGIWEHEGVGWYPGDWNRSCRILAENGFTALLPNMTWAGLAHYPSQVLPQSGSCKRLGDQLAQALTAARKHGLQLHAWVVCWDLHNAPETLRAKMRKEGRLQLSASGVTKEWLSPSDPRNSALLIDALKELVTNYDVDGIHLDYIRYPGSDFCYSPATRAAFEKWLGKQAGDWPRSVLAGGKLEGAFAKFRVDQINLTVRAVHQQVRPLRPGLRISAAVFSTYPECVRSVGQDWKAWLEKGWVDFVCPMTYTTDTTAFTALTRAQIEGRRFAGRVYPGIGVTSNEAELQSDQVIDQVLSLRRLGANGFVLFDMSEPVREDVLPVLRLGITRPPP